jgi:esterase/lipase superfamily enzyme
MHREYHRWYSPRLQRDMELLIHGHAGARVLVFPTSQGRFYEYEDRGMVANLGDHLEHGHFQLFCVDSIDAETFYNWWAHPSERITRHAQYESYLLHEVLPLMQAKNGNPFLITHGCSFGAYHAVNFAFRHPHLVGRVLALSGKYDMTNFFGGYYDDMLYFHTPSHYIPNLDDPARLDALKRMDIILVVGKEDPNIENNRQLSAALWSKGVWHAFREWEGWSHDWPYWAKMTRLYIGGHD